MEYQDEKKMIVCTLCFEPCETNCRLIDDSASKMMALLFLQHDLQKDGQSKICNKCADKLKTCFEFKSSCLSLENHLDSFASEKGNTKLDLSFPSGNECSLPEYPTIYCLCRKSAATCDLSTSSIENKIDVSLEGLLNIYFPELSLNTTQNLSVCASCNEALKAFFNAMNNWSDIRQKIEGNNVMAYPITENHTDLNLISQFEVKREPVDTDSNVGDIFSGNEDSKATLNECSETTKLFSPLNLQGQEFVITPEEVELKMEQDDYRRLEENTVDSCQYEGTKTKVDTSPNLDDQLKQMTQEDIFQCKVCDFKTRAKSTLKRHMLTHCHPSEVIMYQCEKCEFRTKHKESIKRHLTRCKDPTEPTIYQCHECAYKSKHKSMLNRHMVQHQAESDITFYQCTKCDYKAKQTNHLKTHMVVHQDPSEVTMYDCDKCEFKTKYKSYLKKHITSHLDSSEVTMYKCDQCDYTTRHRFAQKRHIASHLDSSNATMYQCDICGHKSKRKPNLIEHMITHRDPSEVTMYQCNKCEYKAKRKSRLKHHDILVHQAHSDITLYQCAQCDYKAKHKGHLKTHMISHQNPSEVTIFNCEKCQYKTKYKSYLKRHLVSHQDSSEVTTYKCDKCDYRTKYKCTLKKHTACHLDSSNVTTVYPCNKCNYKAKREYCLKQHDLTVHQTHADISVC